MTSDGGVAVTVIAPVLPAVTVVLVACAWGVFGIRTGWRALRERLSVAVLAGDQDRDAERIESLGTARSTGD